MEGSLGKRDGRDESVDWRRWMKGCRGGGWE